MFYTKKVFSLKGQATIEYVIITAIVISMFAILMLFRETFLQYAYRIIDMVSSDYP